MKSKKRQLNQPEVFSFLTFLLVLIVASSILFGQISAATAEAATPAQKKDASKPALIAVVGGTLIDGTGKEPLPKSVILIEGNKIKTVGPATQVKIPKEAQK
ncbi:MAG TPA: hypothetical protein PKZ83_17585, partial [bacterium]|nr:hypothetical protein [bacterium]